MYENIEKSFWRSTFYYQLIEEQLLLTTSVVFIADFEHDAKVSTQLAKHVRKARKAHKNK